jgi:hypothetical protein
MTPELGLELYPEFGPRKLYTLGFLEPDTGLAIRPDKTVHTMEYYRVNCISDGLSTGRAPARILTSENPLELRGQRKKCPFVRYLSSLSYL